MNSNFTKNNKPASSFLGAVFKFFPAFHFSLIIASMILLFCSQPFDQLLLRFLILIFFVYCIPVLICRALLKKYPLKEGLSYLDTNEFNSWWGAHNLQLVFIHCPMFENALMVFPGLFSLWLRAWGSKIGKQVYWAPGIKILDRSALIIEDKVLIGYETYLLGHVIKRNKAGRLVLFYKQIFIGQNSFIGAGSKLGPGAKVEANLNLPIRTEIYVNKKY